MSYLVNKNISIRNWQLYRAKNKNKQTLWQVLTPTVIKTTVYISTWIS